MKRLFIFIASLVLVSAVFTSCSDYNVFRDVALGSDMESVENVLKQNSVKYKTYPAAPMLDIDVENPEEIADALMNDSAGFLGDMLYKESIYYVQNISGIRFESQIFFFDEKCTNVSLNWHVKSNPSVRNGYLASEKLRAYISQQYPDKKFESGKDKFNKEKYVMQISDTVSITITADTDTLSCEMEDSVLQAPCNELKEKVNEICHYYSK